MNFEWKRRFTWIDMSEVGTVFHKNPFPERGHRGDLGPLHLSIARCGVINPIITRVKEGKLQVICGYRRWLAAQVAGIAEIPVVVTNLNDEDARQLFSEEGAVKEIAAPDGHPSIEEPDAALESSVSAQQSENLERTHNVTPKVPKAGARLAISEDDEILGSNIDERVERLYAMTCEVFRETLATRQLPMQPIHDLTEELCVLEPLSRGVDIRDVGSRALEDGQTLDACDFLAAHGLRVAMLAQAFGLSSSGSGCNVLQLIRAGLTHDVGMLFVPDEWFDSPFPLTRDRQLAIQKHTEIGREIMEKSGEPLADVAMVARDHHERCDGTGYPEGKRGTAIGEFPQIVGLIDSYAAMVSVRSYREPYLLGEALNVLREAGQVGIFSPELVRTFLGVVSSWPVGACGRIVDGATIRVQSVERDRTKTHLARVIEAGTRFRCGEELWLRESELPAMATEVLPPSTRTTTVGAASS